MVHQKSLELIYFYLLKAMVVKIKLNISTCRQIEKGFLFYQLFSKEIKKVISLLLIANCLATIAATTTTVTKSLKKTQVFY